MDAQRLTIVSKVREHPVVPVSLNDFQYREAEAVEPQAVLERSTISLYCLDHPNRRAIFVETPPEVDLRPAPFYYQAQYEAAQYLIAVPYDTLHALASTVQVDPRHIILIYSTGRCGSTLVSRALSQAEGVISFSEPDFYTQIQALRSADGSNDAEFSDLARSCTLILCGGVQHGGTSACAIKFRSWGIELGALLYRTFPEAKVIFLYRHAEPWARSFARMARMFEPEGEQVGRIMYQAVGPLIPLVARYMTTHSTPMPPIEMLACMWVSVMVRCLDLQRQGVPMFAARYEELKTEPREVLTAMFAYCGLTVSSSEAIDRLLEQDSQAGTTLSQAHTQQSRSMLSDDQVVELNRLIQHYAPTLRPDSIVPQTFPFERSIYLPSTSDIPTDVRATVQDD